MLYESLCIQEKYDSLRTEDNTKTMRELQVHIIFDGSNLIAKPCLLTVEGYSPHTNFPLLPLLLLSSHLPVSTKIIQEWMIPANSNLVKGFTLTYMRKTKFMKSLKLMVMGVIIWKQIYTSTPASILTSRVYLFSTK